MIFKFLQDQIVWLEFNQTEVLFTRNERYGKTGYSLSKTIHFAMNGITSFSESPTNGYQIRIYDFFYALIVIFYTIYSHFS